MSARSDNRRNGAETYLRAEIPRSFTILGQKLLPFSLWHLQVLMRLENSFVTDGKLHGGDLFLGVFFCCQSWEEGLKALDDHEWEKRVSDWGESVGRELVTLKGGVAELALEEKAIVFAEYLREGCGRPELLPPDVSEDARTPGAPLLLMLKLFLMEKLRKSESEAMNYSFAKACHDFFAYYEQHGAAKIMNEDERETFQEHERVAREIIEELAVKKRKRKGRKKGGS